MATTRRRNPYTAPTVSGAPAGTTPASWVDAPSVNPDPTGPRIDDTNGFDMGTPYNPGNNSGFAGGGATPSIQTGNWNIAPPNLNIGPWASGLGPQPSNVTIPGQAGTAPTSNAAFGANSAWGTGDTITQFFRSRGLSDQNQLDRLQRDWTGWWNAWGARDPEYFWRRIQQENDLIGGPQNSEFAGNSPNEFNDYWGSTLEGLINQYLGNSKDRAAHLAQTYRSRAKELRDTPAYSAQDEAALQAKAYDQLERRRQETLKNERERIYARGFAPTSGTVAGRERDVNTRFEDARTGISSDILRAQLDETNRRKDAATQLEALATEALNGGDLGAIQATGLPLQLMTTRQNNALAAYNSSSGNIGSLLSMLLSAASGQQQTTNNQNANNAAGYGSLVSILLNSLFPR